MQNNDDNYLKFLQAKKGETYLLSINDYHANGSLSISIDGTAKLDPMNECKEDENHDLQIVNVFPNPVQEQINVEVNFNIQSDEIMQITIMDLNSRKIKSKSINSEKSSSRIQMDIDDLTSGSIKIEANNYEFRKVDVIEIFSTDDNTTTIIHKHSSNKLSAI